MKRMYIWETTPQFGDPGGMRSLVGVLLAVMALINMKRSALENMERRMLF